MRISAICLTLVFLAGCSGPEVETQGVVTLDGQPLEGASVAFLPASGEGSAAYATTDEKGRFRLETFELGGVAPGKYKVLVTKYSGGKSGRAKSLTSLLPKTYADMATTPYEVVVPHDGDVQLALKSR